jgi:hypothetical protein
MREEIQKILKRNDLFDKYDDSEGGSFSEGERVIVLIIEELVQVEYENKLKLKNILLPALENLKKGGQEMIKKGLVKTGTTIIEDIGILKEQLGLTDEIIKKGI